MSLANKIAKQLAANPKPDHVKVRAEDVKGLAAVEGVKLAADVAPVEGAEVGEVAGLKIVVEKC